MIHINVFTDASTIEKRFAPLVRSRTYTITFHPGKSLHEVVSKTEASTICYLDVASVTGNTIKQILKSRLDNPNVRFAVIDEERSVTDIAELFHLGAVDYLGPELLSGTIPVKRLKKVADHERFPAEKLEAETPGRQKREFKLIPKCSWKQVETGKEYTFVFLYVQIDLTDEWRKKSGKDHLNDVKTAFRKHIELEVGRSNGKVWIWADLGGIVLFPFNGTQSPVIERCMKFVLDRTIISAERYSYNTLITYRMAIHIGNTVYQSRGNTGTLVSDTVNFVFHLGQKYLKRGNLYVTEPVASYIDPGLADCFVPVGTFEQVGIRRMLLPIR